MKNKNQYVVALILLLQFTINNFLAQESNYPKSYTTTIGTSAISINTLTAKTYSFSHLIYDFKLDTLAKQVYVTTRKKDPTGKLYTNIGMFVGLNASNDSLKWFKNTTQFEINIDNEFLFASDNQKTSRYNKTFGYEQFQFPSKIIYTIKKYNYGLMYNPNNKDELTCVKLQDGTLKWKAIIPSQQNWNDVNYLNDTTLIVAANGLHAININTGLLWSKPFNTVQKNNKPLVFSYINNDKVKKEFNAINTSTVEAQISGISSNILISDTLIYFASKDKLICVTQSGKLQWEKVLDETISSQMLISKINSDIILLNTGIAQYNDFSVMYGKAYAMSVNAITGTQNYKNNSAIDNLADYCNYKNDLIFANKTNIAKTNIANTALESIIEVNEREFGKFVEFINGDNFYVEKEGFYVPLNFINDNVIYFRTDNDKVYGVAKNNVEYEYHYTELFKLNNSLGDKKIITQRNKSIMISKNFELLFNFKIDVPCYIIDNKIYFLKDQYLHIINYNDLK
jgi:hypothetical protein